MNYSVRLAGLLACCEQLEQSAKQQRQEIDELTNVVTRLKDMYAMPNIVVRLRKRLQSMEEQAQLLLTMAQASRRCYQAYLDTEQAVLDMLEEGSRHVSRTVQIKPLQWRVDTTVYLSAMDQAGISMKLSSQ